MKRTLKILFCLAITITFILCAFGCKKPEPARIIITIEGELFSDADLSIDGKPAGSFTQTLIKTDGKLYINKIYTATLPPGHRDIPEEDAFTGAIDSIELIAGDHTIAFNTDGGKTLQIKVNVPPGRHLVTYFSDEEKLRWNDTEIKAAQGSTVTIKATK